MASRSSRDPDPVQSHAHALGRDEEGLTTNDEYIYESLYTVLIRVPVNRGEFIDPQPVREELLVSRKIVG